MAKDVDVCPRCDGERFVNDATTGGTRPCPTCSGQGVKWREAREAAADPGSAGDPTELRGL